MLYVPMLHTHTHTHTHTHVRIYVCVLRVYVHTYVPTYYNYTEENVFCAKVSLGVNVNARKSVSNDHAKLCTSSQHNTTQHNTTQHNTTHALNNIMIYLYI